VTTVLQAFVSGCCSYYTNEHNQVMRALFANDDEAFWTGFLQ
jgi:hypothetical protein